MPPKKQQWDEESDESTPPSSPPPTARRANKFDDEEEDSDVLESWDAAEDSEVEREKAKKAAEAKAKADAEAKANHKSKTQRIAERQAENARRRQEEDEDDSSEDEDEAEKRARLLKEQKAADLRHAEDLFGDVGTNNNKVGRSKHITVSDPNDPTKSIDLTTLSLFDPKTKNDFTQLRETLGPLLANNYKKAQYVLFLQEFTKIISKDLKSDEIKKIASGLTSLSNERMKEEKAAAGGNKKSKAAKTKTTLNTGRDTGVKADTATYEEDFGDDDFM